MKRTLALVIVAVVALLSSSFAAAGPKPQTLPVDIRTGSQYALLKNSSRAGSQSALFEIKVPNASTSEILRGVPSPMSAQRPDYANAPLLLTLRGSRTEIGYDYADITAEQTAFTFNTFLDHVVGNSKADQKKLCDFIDWLWTKWYADHTPHVFLAELAGMKQWASENPARASHVSPLPDVVSRRFYVLANMPADPPNIIAALERDLEQGWPDWLKVIVNDIIRILEKLGHHCDFYSVWGARTAGSQIFASRNLDFSKNTGIDKFKLVTVYDITDGSARVPKYSSFGFTFGLGALAGMSPRVSVSEMNLDNNVTTFEGVPFPLRLRFVLEGANDLHSAMTIWNATNNTNSFNFGIASLADKKAYALETIAGFTGQFPADSPIEAAATFDCGYPSKGTYVKSCAKWTWQPQHRYGAVPIGFPLTDCVWRTNHGFNPTVMRTQEPLFNGTVFRYRLMHDLFDNYQRSGNVIGVEDAVAIVASLGTKGRNFLTCEQDLSGGDNILSVMYHLEKQTAYVAWERGGAPGGTTAGWRPAACSPYVAIDFSQWW